MEVLNDEKGKTKKVKRKGKDGEYLGTIFREEV
jgi:hypothetical protein